MAEGCIGGVVATEHATAATAAARRSRANWPTPRRRDSGATHGILPILGHELPKEDRENQAKTPALKRRAKSMEKEARRVAREQREREIRERLEADIRATNDFVFGRGDPHPAHREWNFRAARNARAWR